MADLYQDAEILVYPYGEVTTSGALMTGIGYGKAIVATRLPAFEQLLHDGENALLVAYGDTPVRSIDLAGAFNDPDTSEAVRLTTVLGPLDIALFGQQKPITVTNFLHYIDEGRYFIEDPTTHLQALSSTLDLFQSNKWRIFIRTPKSWFIPMAK